MTVTGNLEHHWCDMLGSNKVMRSSKSTVCVAIRALNYTNSLQNKESRERTPSASSTLSSPFLILLAKCWITAILQTETSVQRISELPEKETSQIIVKFYHHRISTSLYKFSTWVKTKQTRLIFKMHLNLIDGISESVTLLHDLIFHLILSYIYLLTVVFCISKQGPNLTMMICQQQREEAWGFYLYI